MAEQVKDGAGPYYPNASFARRMKAFWGMPESGEVTDLRTEIKRLISDSTMSNRDKFVGFVGAFNKYDREVKDDNHSGMDDIMKDLQAYVYMTTLTKDFPFRTLLVFRVIFNWKKYDCEEMRRFVENFISAMELEEPKVLSEVLMTFIEQGKFRLPFLEEDKEYSVFDILELACRELSKTSIKIHMSQVKGTKRLYNNFLRDTMIWISMAMKLREVQNWTPKEIWQKTILQSSDFIEFSPAVLRALGTGLEIGQLLQLPLEFSFNSQHLAALFVNETLVRPFKHVMEGLEVVEKFISSEHLLIFSAMMRLEYDKRCSSADLVNLGSMCYAKNPSECLDEVFEFLGILDAILTRRCSAEGAKAEMIHWVKLMQCLVFNQDPVVKIYANSLNTKSDLEKELQEKTQQILQLSGAEEKLQGKLKRRNSTVTKLEGELKEREGIVTRLQEELSERKEMTEKGDEVTKLRGELEEKETEFTRLREEKESTVIRLQVELREIEGTVTRLEGEAREREGTVTRLEGEAREREGTVTRLQGELREREGTITRLEGEVTRLQGELGERDTTVNRLQGVLEERDTTVTRLERELGEKDTAVTGLEGELRERQTALSNVQGQLAGQREHYVTELRQVRQEAEQYQRQLREEQVQRQQLVTRIEAAVGYLRGEAVSPQALELWELPREQVHISQTILGTGGWGYVARGTFQGQAVAVKCLHRGILSPQNEGRLRREISIMSQVRHPNLLLLIGAVLTAEGRGPLIVTELLDKSLRSAYEEGLLEERSKVPVLRDVSSALTYLHSHRTPIIHRDVSSANVLLEAIRDGQWKGKLSDFGSANLSHLASTPAEGAAVYAAPEVSTEDRSRQTPKIDVYSFGVLMCEVCLCRFPPERRELPSMLDEVQNGAPHMFPLSRDCTSHAHQDRPAMREVLQRIDQLTAAEAVQ